MGVGARAALVFSVALLLLAGCTVSSVQTNLMSPMATPTIHSYFARGETSATNEAEQILEITAIPTIADFFNVRSTSTPPPVATPQATLPSPTRDLSSVDVENYAIFDDQLNENWEVLENPDAGMDLASTDQVHTGEKAIAFTPNVDFTTLFFAVKPDSQTVFSYEETLGLSFWLNGGDDYIEPDELAVTVIGSNDFTYWNPDDKSVDLPVGEYFSETRLYHLGLNGSIPPGTWVQIFVWIDNLIYDPYYNYITGFYIKNDEGFYNTIYVDDVEIIRLAKARDENTGQQTPAGSFTPTAEGATATPHSADTLEAGLPEATATAVCIITPPPGWVQYTVQPNDAISTLAVQAGVALNTVIEVNCLSSDGILSIGKQIWLPRIPATATPNPVSPPTGSGDSQ